MQPLYFLIIDIIAHIDVNCYK